MLTISLDRLSDLLEQAAELELALPLLAEDENDGEDTGAAAAEDTPVEDLVEDDRYQDLVQSLATLTPAEQRELMALAFLARRDADAEEWTSMLEEARSLDDAEVLGELARVLVLTDEIEDGLDRLGLDLDDDEVSEEDEEEEEEEEEEDEEEEDEDQ